MLLVPFARTVMPGATGSIPIPASINRFKVRGVGPEVMTSPGDRLIVINNALMHG